MYITVYVYARRPPHSSKRLRLHLLAWSTHPFPKQPSKQGPAEDISPASLGSQAAAIEES